MLDSNTNVWCSLELSRSNINMNTNYILTHLPLRIVLGCYLGWNTVGSDTVFQYLSQKIYIYIWELFLIYDCRLCSLSLYFNGFSLTPAIGGDEPWGTEYWRRNCDLVPDSSRIDSRGPSSTDTHLLVRGRFILGICDLGVLRFTGCSVLFISTCLFGTANAPTASPTSNADLSGHRAAIGKELDLTVLGLLLGDSSPAVAVVGR